MEINLNGGSLVWLRRDLRLEDNNAILKALSFETKIAICFVFDETILNPLLCEPLAIKDSANLVKDRRVSFIHQTLKELDENLKKIRSRLIVKYGFSNQVIPKLVKELQVKNLICSSDYEPEAIARDSKIKNIIKEIGVNFISVKDQCLFEKTEILSKSYTPYTVFTPYKRTWLEKFFSDCQINANIEKPNLSGKIINLSENDSFSFPSLKEMGFSDKSSLPFNIKTGSSGARTHLKEFLTKIDFYKLKRDFPAISGTSYLSIHLRFGTISIRELVKEILNSNLNFPTLSEGSESWLSELVWREFYMQILFNFPHVASGCFKKNYDSIKWVSSKSLFECWSNGLTGYPIIDAGMRQDSCTTDSEC